MWVPALTFPMDQEGDQAGVRAHPAEVQAFRPESQPHSHGIQFKTRAWSDTSCISAHNRRIVLDPVPISKVLSLLHRALLLPACHLTLPTTLQSAHTMELRAPAPLKSPQ